MTGAGATTATDRTAPSLGTFIGVFTPSILTILGVILFLRIGWVVGHVGLVPALAVVVAANLITLATALSVSAIATNMHVGVGGAYYMISRSLGLELGGAIGVPLYLSQVRSTALRLRALPPAPRNRRPHLLVFSGDIERRIDLVRLAAWLNQGRGLLTSCAAFRAARG